MSYNRIALIPAYEPDGKMLSLLEECKSSGFFILIVDDGSGKEYEEIFDKAGKYAKVLTYPENQGKGHAIKTGLNWIKEHCGQEEYTVVTLDADGQHKVEDALRVSEEARKHPDSLILGSRNFDGKVPLRSRMGNTITRLVYFLATKKQIYDTQTGLRGFDRRLIPELLSVSGERYEYEMNVLLEFPKREIELKEIGIETIYLENNASSHFDTLKDSWKIYSEIIKFTASSFTGFLTDYLMYGLLLMGLTKTGTPYGVTLANVGARVVSAGVNYSLNRKFVFQSETDTKKSALEYFLLAVVILIGNTVVLNMLVQAVGMNRYFAKICTELLFFILSWVVQRKMIFRKEETKACL